MIIPLRLSRLPIFKIDVVFCLRFYLHINFLFFFHSQSSTPWALLDPTERSPARRILTLQPVHTALTERIAVSWIPAECTATHTHKSKKETPLSSPLFYFTPTPTTCRGNTAPGKQGSAPSSLSKVSSPSRTPLLLHPLHSTTARRHQPPMSVKQNKHGIQSALHRSYCLSFLPSSSCLSSPP